MSDVFPKWTNGLPWKVLVGVLLIGSAAVAAISYYATPKYTRVGYQPKQPVPFSHAIHAGQLGMDCRYCHNGVESSWFSNIPAASVCMNCHNQVRKDDPKLALVRESYETGKPIPWVQVHKVPDYVYFNHSVHVNRGFSCVECHGQINEMDEVYHAKPFGMSFCLECHREPEQRIRPLEKVTDLDWSWDDNDATVTNILSSLGVNSVDEAQAKMVHDWRVESLINCSACHR
ncbi:MAG: cytochrome c3 family protein [Limisphaerales bacterium]|jgi:formate-dependent nitrite reductase cytochrome c552 subunit